MDALKNWFLSEKRDFPWRENPTPYQVWISEVMLQQTQAAVVIPYFLRWIQRFPTIEALAKAPLDDVIKAWEGLGYYSRARNLHAGAQFIIDHFEGKLPSSETELRQIKGIGPYTVGAILSFAFHQKKAAVDGNVMRVLARYFEVHEEINHPAVRKKIEQLAQFLLPDQEPWVIVEALIELGATICQKTPKCSACPLQTDCRAFKAGLAHHLPLKSKRHPPQQLYRAVAVIEAQGLYLVHRGRKGAIMADLYEFPYFPTDKQGLTPEEFHALALRELDLNLTPKEALPSLSHTFTQYRTRLDPYVFAYSHLKPRPGAEWLTLDQLQKKPFSSGHKRILHMLLSRKQIHQ